jgi:hypothetical protein
MDVVAATFHEAAQAGLAASHLASELGLDEALVRVESIPDVVAAEDEGGTLGDASSRGCPRPNASSRGT